MLSKMMKKKLASGREVAYNPPTLKPGGMKPRRRARTGYGSKSVETGTRREKVRARLKRFGGTDGCSWAGRVFHILIDRSSAQGR